MVVITERCQRLNPGSSPALAPQANNSTCGASSQIRESPIPALASLWSILLIPGFSNCCTSNEFYFLQCLFEIFLASCVLKKITSIRLPSSPETLAHTTCFSGGGNTILSTSVMNCFGCVGQIHFKRFCKSLRFSEMWSASKLFCER